MTETPKPAPKPVMSEKERRDLALQKALRDNLRRRKAGPAEPAVPDAEAAAKDGGEGR